MRIRAHHLLCMRYFKGKGYSKKFVYNFYRVIKRLKNNPTIRVIDSLDAICLPCLYNVGDRCIKKGHGFGYKVKEKDSLILNYLGVAVNQKIRFSEAVKLVDEKLGSLKEICKECEWKMYCG